MYDELLETLRLCAEYDADCATCKRYGQGVCYDKIKNEAADAIEELQAAEKKYLANISALETENQHLKRERDWIPVTERLPKMQDGENISKEVYVTDGTDISEACIMRDYDGATSWTYTGIGEITHWCEQIPLPQPPKEE